MLDKFGKLLRDIRTTRSLLLFDMARDLGLSSAELSAIETGRSPIPDDFIPRLDCLYGIGDGCAKLLESFKIERYRIQQGLWCEWQGTDDKGIYCSAHVHEDRVFNCPYSSLKDRNESSYPCSDYHPIGVIGVSEDP